MLKIQLYEGVSRAGGPAVVVEPCAELDAAVSEILYTKKGRPLQFDGRHLWSKSGVYIGPVIGNIVYDTRGAYAATIVGSRVIRRSSDSAHRSGPTSVANRAGTATASAAGTGEWGDEPAFPD